LTLVVTEPRSLFVLWQAVSQSRRRSDPIALWRIPQLEDR